MTEGYGVGGRRSIINRSGLKGLEDRGRQGRKRRITEAERRQIIALVRQVPPGRLTVQAGGDLSAADEAGPADWTLDSLTAQARQLGIEVGRSCVRGRPAYGKARHTVSSERW
ncbi:helix-turn-helix domain-containing protein [Streptomyces sp. TP-A0356]|uniref:helix-turn-helix domain-containing protein n=1 Tax=Streptomyces sp. TP-A0356 TaxID=1359208 RepID=UPI0006E2CAB8|nr:helix-turn-helix domain-containing protein [Streptomyces sp. TP-A0356]